MSYKCFYLNLYIIKKLAAHINTLVKVKESICHYMSIKLISHVDTVKQNLHVCEYIKKFQGPVVQN